MTLPVLLPLAGAALAPALERVVEGVADSLSFLDVLHQSDSVRDSEQPGDASATGGEAANQLRQDFAQLAEELRQRFAELGIDLNTPLRLKPDSRDGVIVDGDHPDRVVVESIFRDDRELTNLFHAVAAAASSRTRDPFDSNVTREFRLVMNRADASIEFV